MPELSDDAVRAAFAVRLGWEIEGDTRIERVSSLAFGEGKMGAKLKHLLSGWPGFGRAVEWAKAQGWDLELSIERNGGEYEVTIFIGRPWDVTECSFAQHSADPAQAAMRAIESALGEGG